MAISIAGGMSHELHPQTMLAMLLFLFLSSTVIAGNDDMLAFYLTRSSGNSSINEYAAHIQLGPTKQDVYLQPILYSPEFRGRETGVPKPIYVPSVELCQGYEDPDPDEWNRFIRPDDKEGIIDTSGTYEIEWDPDISTKRVNLALTTVPISGEGINISSIASMNLLFRCIWKLIF